MGHCLLNLVLSIIMNRFVIFAGLLALAAGVPVPEAEAEAEAVEAVEAVPATLNAVPAGALAPFLVRAPAHDSASIESHRLGGNFAYAVAEAHAYAQVTPQVSTLTHPVAETTYVHEPATIAKVVPGAVTTTKHIPHPIIETQPILAQEPLVQAKTTFTTPHHKVQTLTHHLAQPITHHQTHHVAPVTAPVYEQAAVAVAPYHVAAPHAVAAPVEGAAVAAVPAGYGYAAPHHFAPHAAHFGYAGFPHGWAPAPVAAEAPVVAEE